MVACSASAASHAAVLSLEGRLPTTIGGTDYQAYYDPNLNITWAADANMNGEMDWDKAKDWAANLQLSGISGWRLPDMDQNNDGLIVTCEGGGVAGCKDNEYGYLLEAYLTQFGVR